MPPEPDGSAFIPLTRLLSAEPAVSDAAAAAGTSSDNPWLSLLLVFILIFVNGFFAAAEIAVITLNDNKLKKMAEDGDKKAIRVLRLTENSSRFLSTIQIGVTLAGLLSSASAAQKFCPAALECHPAPLPHPARHAGARRVHRAHHAAALLFLARAR